MEQDVYNSIIDGHDEIEPDDEPDEEEIITGAPPEIIEVNPDEVIAAEKCLAFTEVIMCLLRQVYGNTCQRRMWSCSRITQNICWHLPSCVMAMC